MRLLDDLKAILASIATVIVAFTVVSPAFHLGSFIGGFVLGWYALLLLEGNR